MNNYFKLEWEVSEQVLSVDFMHLTIMLQGQRLQTTLFKKALNLYLYILPHSAHLTGILSGLGMDMIHWIYTLSSDAHEISSKTRQFYQ